MKIENSKTQFLDCSYHEYSNKLCNAEVYSEQKKNMNYVDLFYERNQRTYNQLDSQQKIFYDTNLYFSFLPKAIYYDASINSLFEISYIYNADDTSLMAGNPSLVDNFSDASYETCEGLSYKEPYDPRCREWYSYALQHKGFNFYEPYVDATNFEVIMTLSSLVRDSNNNFLSVLSIDIGIQNLINSILAQQDQSQQVFSQYNVLLHENKQHVFYHKYYNNTSGILESWVDIEFGPHFNYTEEERVNFELIVSNSIKFMQAGNFSIQTYYNIEPLFQYWTRNGEKFVSLIYPIQMNTQLGVLQQDEKETYASSILIVAIVSKDYRDQLQLFKVFDNQDLIVPFIIESVLLGIFILIFLIHYGILQFKQVYIPLSLLTQFLQKTLKQQLLSACYSKLNYQDSQQQATDQSVAIKKLNVNLFNKSTQITKPTSRIYITNQENLLTNSSQKKLSLQLIEQQSPSGIKRHQKKKNTNLQRKLLVTQPTQFDTLQNNDIHNNSRDRLNNHLLINLVDSPKQIILQGAETILAPTPIAIDSQRNIQYSNTSPQRKNLSTFNTESLNKEENSKIYEQCLTGTPINRLNIIYEEESNNNGQINQSKLIWETIHKKIEKRKYVNSQILNTEEFQDRLYRENTETGSPSRKKSSNDEKQNLNLINDKGRQRENTSMQKNNVSFIREEKSESMATSQYRRTKNHSISSTGTSGAQQESEENIGQIIPMFKEMSVIKETFEQLEQVINYAISSSHKKNDLTQNLFHFANAKITFQKISNISGLNRCYFNLGIISLLMGDYEESIEQLNASVLTYLQGNCISSKEEFVQQMENGESDFNDDKLFLFSKKLFAQSYAYKHLGLSKRKNLTDSKLILTGEQRSLLQKSLNCLLLVGKIMRIKSHVFNILFKLMVLLEFIELYIHLGFMNLSEAYLCQFNEVLQDSDQDKQFKIFKSFTKNKIGGNKLEDQKIDSLRDKRISFEDVLLRLSSPSESSEKIITSMILHSFYYSGLIQYHQGLVKQACENFTLCIEEGKTYSPNLRLCSLQFLHEIFNEQHIDSIEISKMKDQIKNQDDGYDFLILIDCSSMCLESHIIDQINAIKYILEMNFFKKESDRFQIMTYGEEIKIIQNLFQVKNNRQWDITMENILKDIASQERIRPNQLFQTDLYASDQSPSEVTISEALLSAIAQCNESVFNMDNSNNKSIQTSCRKKKILSFTVSNLSQYDQLQNDLFTEIQLSFIQQQIYKPEIYLLQIPFNQITNIKQFSLDLEHFQKDCLISKQYSNLFIFFHENQFFQHLFQQREFQESSNHGLFLSFISNDG